MKSTGIVRKIDELGRVVLPMELRKSFNIKERDSIEIFVENSRIILVPVKTNCMFCGAEDDTSQITFDGHTVCLKCAEKIEAEKNLRLNCGTEKGEKE